jgi:hypothetical protein
MQELSTETNRIAEAALEAYADNIVVRAAVTTIPFVGGPLDLILSTKGQKIVQERVMLLLDALKHEAANLQEEKVDKQYLESEEWFDLILKALEASARTRHIEKLQLYAKVLVGAVVKGNRSKHSPEDYLTILTELTMRELEVAKALYEQQGRDEPHEGEDELKWLIRKGVINPAEHQWDSLADYKRTVPEEDLVFVLLRLQRTGLATEYNATALGYPGGLFIIAPTFRKLMSYLKAAESNETIGVENTEDS